MILSPFSPKELSRTLSVSKLWNKTILDSVELRHTLFLAPQHTKEGSAGYLEFMEGRDRGATRPQACCSLFSCPSRPLYAGPTRDLRDCLSSHTMSS